MKTYRKELWFEVPSRRAFINITPKVEECIPSTFHGSRSSTASLMVDEEREFW